MLANKQLLMPKDKYAAIQNISICDADYDDR